jgi:hypothetical protein
MTFEQLKIDQILLPTQKVSTELYDQVNSQSLKKEKIKYFSPKHIDTT